MHHRDAVMLLSRLGKEVVGRARSRRCVGRAARVAALRERSARRPIARAMRASPPARRGCNQAARAEKSVDGIVGKLLVQRDVDRHDRRRRPSICIAVGGRSATASARKRRGSGRFSTRTACRAAVPTAGRAWRQQFGAAAGCERARRRDRPCRIALRLGKVAPAPGHQQRQQRKCIQSLHEASRMRVIAGSSTWTSSTSVSSTPR